jgi:hypothetical protein
MTGNASTDAERVAVLEKLRGSGEVRPPGS